MLEVLYLCRLDVVGTMAVASRQRHDGPSEDTTLSGRSAGDLLCSQSLTIRLYRCNRHPAFWAPFFIVGD